METRNWPEVIEQLNNSKTGRMTIIMGSPGSAQVTRCRLLKEYYGLDAETTGCTLILTVPR